MKRMVALLLALMLPVCAGAETLSQQLGAPDVTVCEYQSASGRTHVYVDAQVVVPETDTVHIYEVIPRTITPAETEKAANLYFGEQQWWHGDSEKAEVFYTEEAGSPYTVYGCNLYAANNVSRYLTVSYSTVKLLGKDYHHSNWIEILDEQGGFSQNIGTAEDARTMADSFVLAIWPDMVFDSIDPNLSDVNGRLQGQYGYRVYYRRDVDGIPVTPVSMQIQWHALDDTYTPPLAYERLYVDVGEDGIFGLRYEYPAQIGNRISQNVRLLPFAQIMDVFGSIAPLTIASTERGENNTLHIDRIELGYMCVQMKNDPTRYQLIPVWDFFGTYSVSGEVYSHYMKPLVTINAIDGTVIDRKYGY